METFQLKEMWDSESFTAALHAAEHFPLLNVGEWVSRSALLSSVRSSAAMLPLILQIFASSHVSSLGSLPLCSCMACNLACAILCQESCPLWDSFILVMYQVLLCKMQTSHVAWNHLWQPGVISCLTSFDWQVTCQPGNCHSVCVYMFVDLCKNSAQTLRTANMNFP